MIKWEGIDSHILINPRTPDAEREESLQLLQNVHQLESHYFLLTSGTTGKKKWVALHQEAMQASARAVNRHLHVTDYDVWINVLPFFHVGGLSIYTRAALSQSRVITANEAKWDAENFIRICQKEKATLTSLVPTQVYDFVHCGIRSPASLRAVVVGGGALNQDVYLQAVKLGWPLLPSYGLTECASQVATAPLGSWEERKFPELSFLDHVEVRLGKEGMLEIKSKALLTAYITSEGIHDPKENGWLLTEDRVVLGSKGIASVSRGGSFVKVGGESVDLQRLQSLFEAVCLQESLKEVGAIVAVADQRKGSVIALLVEGELQIEPIVDRFNQQVLPFERICQVQKVEKIPRSPLGKILRSGK